MITLSSFCLLTLSLQALPASQASQVAPVALPEYDLILIEPWNTTYALATSNASGINNLNQVSGAATPLTGSSSFLWTLATDKVQVNLAGRINDQGIVAGANAIRLPDGTLEVFDLLDVAQDINNRNMVAGTWGTTACNVGMITHDEAGVWHPLQGTVLLQPLGVPATEHARAINELGQVVGVSTSTGECGDFRAFYLDLVTQQYIDLHALLVGGGSLGLTQAFDINDIGFVLGEGPHGATVQSFLWNAAGGFRFLPPPTGAISKDTHFEGVNNLNQAVGASLVDTGGGSGPEWRAVIWDDVRGTRDLNELVRLPANFVVDGANEINDNGWIIGSGHYGPWSPSRAVVLIPKR